MRYEVGVTSRMVKNLKVWRNENRYRKGDIYQIREKFFGINKIYFREFKKEHLVPIEHSSHGSQPDREGKTDVPFEDK